MKKADFCLFLQDGRGQPQLPPPPLNYVNKQETTSLTESGLPRLACGLMFFRCFTAEKRHINRKMNKRGGENKSFLSMWVLFFSRSRRCWACPVGGIGNGGC